MDSPAVVILAALSVLAMLAVQRIAVLLVARDGLLQLAPADQISLATPIGSCGPRVLVATVAVGVQDVPWHGSPPTMCI